MYCAQKSAKKCNFGKSYHLSQRQESKFSDFFSNVAAQNISVIISMNFIMYLYDKDIQALQEIVYEGTLCIGRIQRGTAKARLEEES